MPKAKKRGGDADIHDLLKIHIESWGRLSELIKLSREQRDAGNLKVAREDFRSGRAVARRD